MSGRLRSLFDRWPRYLTEVLVIIFSVLAAFWLDSWNDDRSRTREEVAILQSAQIELERDLSDIEYNVRHHEEAVRSIDLILEHLEGGAPYHDSLAVHFHNGLNMPRFVHSTSAFQTMQSRGMDIVANEEIRRRLIRLYGASYANYLTAETEHASEIAYGVRTIMASRFREGFNFDEVGRTYHGTMVPIDFERLRDDQEYLYYLRTLRNRTDVLVNFSYRNLRNGIEEVHDLVAEEILGRTR
jgi:hypothetical protein